MKLLGVFGFLRIFIWMVEFDLFYDEVVDYVKKFNLDGVEVVFFDYRLCIYGFDSIFVDIGVI